MVICWVIFKFVFCIKLFKVFKKGIKIIVFVKLKIKCKIVVLCVVLLVLMEVSDVVIYVFIL